MSHFSVLVITDTGSETELQKVLQPFHEYECTGTEDEYVLWVDRHDKATELYNSKTRTRWKDKEGALHDPYEDQFYRDPLPDEDTGLGGTGFNGKNSFHSKDWKDGRGYRAKIHLNAEDAGMEAVEIPVKDLESLEDWAKDYGGWEMRDGRLCDYTNPNKKWDWWQVGGRYSGKFTPGYDPDEDPRNQETCFICHGSGKRADMEVANGCNGCQGKGIATKWPTNWADCDGNRVQVKDIPWEAMEQYQVKIALETYDKAAALTAGMKLPPSWKSMREQYPIDEAREKYNAYPAVQALKEYWDTDAIIEKLKKTRQEIIEAAQKEPVGCFAILHEGKWYERGKMGWWACVSDELDEEVWSAKVNALLRGLPPEKYITVVDCHI